MIVTLRTDVLSGGNYVGRWVDYTAQPDFQNSGWLLFGATPTRVRLDSTGGAQTNSSMSRSEKSATFQLSPVASFWVLR